MTRNCHYIWIRPVNTLTRQITKSIPIIKWEKMIVNLGSKKLENNDTSTCQLTSLQSLLLISIVDTPEKDVSNVDRKVDKRKVRTFSIKSSSTLFFCSIHAIYNRVHCAQNQRLMLISFIPAINTSIFPKEILWKYIFWKTYQWITCLDLKSSSCNTFSQCQRLSFFQNKWYSGKETKASTSNLSTRAT